MEAGEDYILQHRYKVLGLTWSSIERIPLYHFYPGSIVLKAWIAGCPLKCNICIDRTINVPLDSLELKSINEDVLIDFLYRIKSSILFFHGGEVLAHWGWLRDIISKLKMKGVLIGAKTTCLIETTIIKEALRVLDVLLVEIALPGITCKERIRSNLEYLKKSETHIEVLLLVNCKIENEVWREILKLMEDLRRDTPIMIYSLIELPYSILVGLRRTLLKEKFNYVYIIDDPFYKFEHTYCPKCKYILIERHNRLLRSCLLKNTSCPKCGCKINIKGKCKPPSSRISLFISDEPLL